MTRLRAWAGVLLLLLLASCGKAPWNDPYQTAERGQNTLYSVFSERPKHLDPARSYSSNEVVFTGQIYEPPLQYHYLKRPYQLEPLTVRELPQARYFDAQGKLLATDAPASQVAVSEYEIHILPGIRYQPHPAFAQDAQGRLLYHSLSPAELEKIETLSDFKISGTRELTADDYVYQIKRLAHPRLNSPIFGLMADYIIGLKEYGEVLAQADKQLKRDNGAAYLDLNRYPLAGAEVVDRYTYRVKLKGKYPQFVYWLAMPFFAPVPWEAERFYSQAGMKAKNLLLDWYPVGTGPYMLSLNDPNKQMVMVKNPNYRGDRYPHEGDVGDREAGLLADAGKTIPFIERAVYSLEKEDIPYWNKFLQGYYDSSGINSDTFDQAVKFGAQGEAALTPDLQEKNIRLATTVQTTISYMGFNMQDPLVGGLSERARKLRQAISIAVDYEEFISIFRNGRGIAAQGPIPPGIFGYVEGEAGVNRYMYDWANGRAQRKSIDEAKRLLAQAGYPNGRDAQSGKPLLLHFDTAATGPDAKARLEWLSKQLKKIDLQLLIRATDYNRFQDKMLKGDAQLFEWGWNADYPDPENFLFLLHGPNKKVGLNGENAANYDNPEFNRLFEQMKNMDNGPARQQVIDAMIEIARHDAPWVWGFIPKAYGLYHGWYFNAKPNLMANNGLKYLRIDPALRERQRAAWNKPLLWPLFALGALLLLALVPAVFVWRRKLHAPARGEGAPK
ncbi:MAG: ABC transporter substrate-binding protein [Pseudomonadota bacterium]